MGRMHALVLGTSMHIDGCVVVELMGRMHALIWVLACV